MSDVTESARSEPSRAPAPEGVVAAVGDVLQALARSSVDVTDVMQVIVARAVALCRADNGDILVLDGEVLRAVAFVGVNPEAERRNRELSFPPGRGSIVGRAIADGRVVHVADVTQDPEYELLDLQRIGGYRTVLGVPLLRDGVAIGAMAIQRNQVAPFSDEEVEVVSLFAEQAALALRIADLLTETREALDREVAVSEVLQSISGSAFDLDEVLETIIASAVELSGADFGNILRLDDATGFYQQVARAGPGTAEFWAVVKDKRFGPDRGTLVGRTLIERRAVHIVDVLEDREFTFWEAQRAGGFRTTLGIPMLRDDLPIGVVVLNRTEVRPFTEREIALVTTFADQAVLAIENVRLFQTVERQRTELARYAPQVASLLSSDAGEQLLAGHRREITALFADLRGFTSFAENAEPEEVLDVLREYHALAGDIVVRNGGTVEHFAGDGLMAFFNDPARIADHPVVAVRAAIELRDAFASLADRWRKRGYTLGLGMGVAVGYATLGRIGFEGRYDYGAVGNVVIVASRLSDAAAAGEILISQRLNAAVEDDVQTAPVADLDLKGFSRPVPAFRLV